MGGLLVVGLSGAVHDAVVADGGLAVFLLAFRPLGLRLILQLSVLPLGGEGG